MKLIQRYCFLFLNKNIYFVPSLELCHQDGSDVGSQYMAFMEKCLKLSLNYLRYPFFSGALFVVLKDCLYKA